MADIDNGLGEGPGGFLRDIVANIESPVRVPAREVIALSGAVPGRREWIVLAVNGYGGHRDNWGLLKPVFDAGIFGLTRGPALAPAIITDDNADEVRVVKGLRSLTICCLRELQVGELNFQTNNPSSYRYFVRPMTPRCVSK